jgi:hypothetical protein
MLKRGNMVLGLALTLDEWDRRGSATARWHTQTES